LGEVFMKRGKSAMPVAGDINICEEAKRLGKKSCKLTKAEAAQAFHRQLLDAGLHPDEVAFVRKVWRFQALNDGQMRLYGSARNLKLVMEFQRFCDDKSFWKRLRLLARECGYGWCVMYVGKHSDRYGVPIPGKPGKLKWTTGPDHGRMERQVEVYLRVPPDARLCDVRTMRLRMRKALSRFWYEAGVGVL
jgi:hypothetical protein